jgi:hypothetical protein
MKVGECYTTPALPTQKAFCLQDITDDIKTLILAFA